MKVSYCDEKTKQLENQTEVVFDNKENEIFDLEKICTVYL